MKKVIGLGGVFFLAKDVKGLKDWYKTHLGFRTTDWGATFLMGSSDGRTSRTEWSPFGKTDYYQPSTLPYMFNYRVADLRGLMAELAAAGIEPVGDVQEFEYGKFGWIMDPEGRKIELWEPVDEGFGDAPEPWTERVTGLGGVFFKSNDPAAMREWYKQHLGVEEMFNWKDLSTQEDGCTVWSPFPANTDYFQPSDKPWMFNYRVGILEKLIATLRAEGVTIVGEIQDYDYGRFAYILDAEGTKIELWEPK